MTRDGPVRRCDAEGRMQPTRLRWKVPFTLCLLAGVTYLVRICISVAAPYSQRDLTLDNIQMSYVFSAFPLAYAIFEMPTGWWADRTGTCGTC